MGFNNPSMPWAEVERLLSGSSAQQRGKDDRALGPTSRKRQPYEPDSDSTQPHWRPDPVQVP